MHGVRRLRRQLPSCLRAPSALRTPRSFGSFPDSMAPAPHRLLAPRKRPTLGRTIERPALSNSTFTSRAFDARRATISTKQVVSRPSRARTVHRVTNDPPRLGVRDRQVPDDALDGAHCHRVDTRLCLRCVFSSLRRIRISLEYFLVVVRANPYELVRSAISPSCVNPDAESRTGRHDVLREDLDKVVEFSWLHRINTHFGRHVDLLKSKPIIDPQRATRRWDQSASGNSARSESEAARTTQTGESDPLWELGRSGGTLGSVPDDAPVLTVANARAWSRWLAKNSDNATGVWLVLAKKGTTDPTSLTYDEALEEALCFGWVDGQLAKGDDRTFRRRFTP